MLDSKLKILENVKNAKPHTLHKYSFSPVCVFMCPLKLLLYVNAVVQTLHVFFTCMSPHVNFKLELYENVEPQT